MLYIKQLLAIIVKNNVELQERIDHFMGTAATFLGGKHGLKAVYQNKEFLFRLIACRYSIFFNSIAWNFIFAILTYSC